MWVKVIKRELKKKKRNLSHDNQAIDSFWSFRDPFLLLCYDHAPSLSLFHVPVPFLGRVLFLFLYPSLYHDLLYDPILVLFPDHLNDYDDVKPTENTQMNNRS